MRFKPTQSTSRNSGMPALWPSRRPCLQLRTQTPTWQSVALVRPSDETEMHIPPGSLKEEGVCLYVNQRWWKTSLSGHVYSWHWATISVHSPPLPPTWVPPNFYHCYLHPPKANANNAVNTIHKVTQKLQTMSLDAPSLILGDFNHCNLKSMSSLYQYITCPTRHEKTLDL